MLKQQDVLGIGIHAIEQVIRLKNFMGGSRTQVCPPWNYEMIEGGFMGNMLIGLMRLDLRTGYLGKVGGDRFGLRLMKGKVNEGIDFRNCEIIPSQNSAESWLILDEKGEQRRILFPNVLSQIDDAYIMQHAYGIKSCRLLLIDVSVISLSACVLAAELAKSEHIPVIVCLNIPEGDLFGTLKSGTPAELEELIAFSDLFLASPGDLQDQVSAGDPFEQAGFLQKKFLIPNIVLLEEQKGCVIATEEEIAYSPAFAVDVLDTLGSRDAFQAGISFGFFHGWSLAQSARFANACSALNSLSTGIHSGMKNEAEIMQFLSEFPETP